MNDIKDVFLHPVRAHGCFYVHIEHVFGVDHVLEVFRKLIMSKHEDVVRLA